jgi:hypothetical protein
MNIDSRAEKAYRQPLVNSEKVLLLLRIKVGLVKSFKDTDESVSGFLYLKLQLLMLNVARFKEGMCVGQ